MEREPDLIDETLQRLAHIEPGIPPDRLAALEDVLRAEFGGIYSRVAKRGEGQRAAMHKAIRDAYRGQPLRELARKLGIHPSTAHRVLGGLKNKP